MSVKNLRLLAAFAAFAALSSCASNREQAWKDSWDPRHQRARQWAKLCEPYAKLSYIAYRNDNDEQRRFEKELKGQGWERLGWCDRDKRKEEGDGLYFEVWENRKLSPREIVLAFRGTQFHDRRDWLANFRWLRWVQGVGTPDQYAFARKECLRVIAKHVPESEIGKVRIVTTGHSLGGGLAQQVLYAGVPNVEQSIVFDPSPVTGYFDLSLDQRKEYLAMTYRENFAPYRIIRAYERGEILEFARNAVRPFYREDPLIHNLEFKAKESHNAISQHSMLMLANMISTEAHLPEEAVVPGYRDAAYREEPKGYQVVRDQGESKPPAIVESPALVPLMPEPKKAQ